jgi:hypothetical protein
MIWVKHQLFNEEKNIKNQGLKIKIKIGNKSHISKNDFDFL